MENNQIMLFEGMHEVMVLTKEDVTFDFKGDFLIRAKDVAKALGYDQTVGITSLVKSKYQYKVKNSDLSFSQIRKLNNAGEIFITSFGLNQAFATSTMPKAEKFQDWLYEDVVPTIQKTGGYVHNDDLFVNTYLKDYDDNVKTLFKLTLQTMRGQNEKIEQLQPKADTFDRVFNSTNSIYMKDVADILSKGFKKHIGRNKLFNYLRTKKVIAKKSRTPHNKYLNSKLGLFTVDYEETNNHSNAVMKVYPKGVLFIYKLLARDWDEDLAHELADGELYVASDYLDVPTIEEIEAMVDEDESEE